MGRCSPRRRGCDDRPADSCGGWLTLRCAQASPYWDQSGIPINVAKQKDPFIGKIVSVQVRAERKGTCARKRATERKREKTRAGKRASDRARPPSLLSVNPKLLALPPSLLLTPPSAWWARTRPERSATS